MRIVAAIALTFGVVVAFVVGILIGALSTGDPQQWEDPDLGDGIYEGVATEGHLWLLGSTGQVVRFDRNTGERRVLAANVRDILADGPHLWAVSIQPESSTFEIRDLNNRALPARSAETSGDVLHLIRMTERVGVLTQDAVFLPSGTDLSRRPLAAPLSSLTTAAVSRSGSVYVGENWGEFGGRLTRIDPQDGSGRQIAGDAGAARTADELCTGDFNPSCDPIVGVLPDSRRPDCIIAASGQFHRGMTRGKVYRVCGDDLTLTYQTPNRTPLIERLFAPTDFWRSLSAPINSLTGTADGWIAMSQGRYYRMRGDQVSEHPMPDFHLWAGLWISEPQDGVLFIMADCCSGSAFDRTHWTLAVPIGS